jgi:hypothetical protein
MISWKKMGSMGEKKEGFQCKSWQKPEQMEFVRGP